MKAKRHLGIIIKRINLGEADRLVSVLTKDSGKITLLGKGIRKIKSRRAPHLELFNEVSLSVHQGRTWEIVTEARTLLSFTRLKNDLTLSAYGFFLLEVTDQLIPEKQVHPEVFDLLHKYLVALNDSSSSKAQEIAKMFVIELLWEVGFLPRGEFPRVGVTNLVEEIIEKRIKSKQFIEEI